MRKEAYAIGRTFFTKRECDKSSFGGYLRTLRQERKIGFDEFRILLGVSKAYLNDVETDRARPPTPEVQVKMFNYLNEARGLTFVETTKFYSLAAVGRGELPADVAIFLTSDVRAVEEIRSSSGYNEFWQNYGK